jgi:PAS domain S-box-containing protein
MVGALLESSAEGILLVDASGRILLANAGAERMFGYAREELVGAELEQLLPERVRPDHRGHRATSRSRGCVRWGSGSTSGAGGGMAASSRWRSA